MKNSLTKATVEVSADLLDNLRDLLADTEKSFGSSAAAETKGLWKAVDKRFSRVREQLDHAYRQSREQVQHAARETDRAIRSHPYEALAVALGVGLLCGALFRRR
ncbi:MAG TPA: hypothetical protein VK178_04765 [Opitutaceae bacterium]|nr:hypothetical protein [Opitutaceae bacterium]